MSFSQNSEYSDVNNDVYLSTNVTVGTTEVEAKVGATAEDARESVRIYNGSSTTIYFGPSGVTTTTGEPLKPCQSVSIPAGCNVNVYMIRAAGSEDVIVQEIG